jgi:hypothetical protein
MCESAERDKNPTTEYMQPVPEKPKEGTGICEGLDRGPDRGILDTVFGWVCD